MERKYFKHLTQRERSELKDKIFRELELDRPEKKVLAIRWKSALTIGVAASALIVIGLIAFNNAGTGKKTRHLIAQTGLNETRQVLLSDSSVIILNGNSTAYANTEYATAAREIFLEGNGFFKVKKLSSGRSFIVHTSSADVSVLGTEFNVNTRNSEFEVALTSGKVKVAKPDDAASAAYITPGQKVSLDNSNGGFKKTQIDVSMYSPWLKGEWNFRNTELADIASWISKYYGTEISFRNDEKRKLRMTAVIPVTNLTTLINVIMETLPVTIENKQDQLIIH